MKPLNQEQALETPTSTTGLNQRENCLVRVEERIEFQYWVKELSSERRSESSPRLSCEMGSFDIK